VTHNALTLRAAAKVIRATYSPTHVEHEFGYAIAELLEFEAVLCELAEHEAEHASNTVQVSVGPAYHPSTQRAISIAHAYLNRL
jgi:hypothetical protein